MIENKPVKRTLGVCRSLVAIVLLGAALRFLDLGRQSMWIDEGFSWLVAQTSFGELTRLSWTDTHPPLYYCLLKISLWVLPDTELGIRVVSALCSIATLVVLIIFVYRHWGRWVIANLIRCWAVGEMASFTPFKITWWLRDASTLVMIGVSILSGEVFYYTRFEKCLAASAFHALPPLTPQRALLVTPPRLDCEACYYLRECTSFRGIQAKAP